MVWFRALREFKWWAKGTVDQMDKHRADLHRQIGDLEILADHPQNKGDVAEMRDKAQPVKRKRGRPRKVRT
jgi:hypothetical protein